MTRGLFQIERFAAEQRNGPRDFRVALEWIPERTRFRCVNEPGEWQP